MDIVKEKKKPKFFDKTKIAIYALVALVVILAVIASQSESSKRVNRSDIVVGTVKQGELKVIVEGYGTLISNRKQLLTSLTQATVKEILLKPGAHVKAESIILRLENPELEQEVERAHQELTQRQANLRQLKVNHQREFLTERATLAEIEALYESARLRRAAEEKLVDNGIVARLDYLETQLTESQLNKRIIILKERIEQLGKVHSEAINIQLEQIKQQQSILNIAQERVNKLIVRAGINGVFQRLSVELGQSLAPGQEIGLIGSVTDLVALIKVPQNQAQQVTIGQKTKIDTRRDIIDGVVSRIDPIVDNNTVDIEIALSSELPASARPQLNVDGKIIIDVLENTVYLERPANVKALTTVNMFAVDENYQNATMKKIKFGKRAGRFIQVISGATPNEKYILSDISNIVGSSSNIIIES